jgi:pimeloyl-ACP methyl ester carboxylesterase
MSTNTTHLSLAGPPSGGRAAVADLPGGIHIPYVEQGDRDGIPVVLLHGLSDSWRSFEAVLPHLAPHVHAYAISQRGQGDASRPGSYRLEELVADVAGFMDAVGLGAAVLCGHSMGSVVATRFAIDHPERTAGLVVMGGSSTFAHLGLEAMDAELRALAPEDYVDYLRGFQESTLARPIPAEQLEIAVSESAKVSVADLRALLWDTTVADFSGELGKVRAPTRLVWGEYDAICPRSEQDKLLTAIPGAQLSVYVGAGHAMHWEEPERFAAELADFCGEILPAWKG